MLTRHINRLREVVRNVKARHPFTIHDWVVLPDHLRCVIELPLDDDDFPLRWRLIKSMFSKGLPLGERRSQVRISRGERGIWQRRYREHLIRDESDFAAHLDYVHINPLKHGLVTRVKDWPFSTFHHLVQQGVYADDWAGDDRILLPEYPD